MVRAHRGIASKLPKGHWLFRLCFDPAKGLRHPTFMPQMADCLACTALYRNGGSGNAQRSLLKSKIVIGRLGGEITGSSASEGERRGIVKVMRRARGTEATISSKKRGSK